MDVVPTLHSAEHLNYPKIAYLDAIISYYYTSFLNQPMYYVSAGSIVILPFDSVEKAKEAYDEYLAEKQLCQASKVPV